MIFKYALARVMIYSLKSPFGAQSPLRKPPALKALADFHVQHSGVFRLALKYDLLRPYSNSYICSLCCQCFSLEVGRMLG